MGGRDHASEDHSLSKYSLWVMMFQQLSSPVQLVKWAPVREAATGAEVQANSSCCCCTSDSSRLLTHTHTHTVAAALCYRTSIMNHTLDRIFRILFKLANLRLKKKIEKTNQICRGTLKIRIHVGLKSLTRIMSSPVRGLLR